MSSVLTDEFSGIGKLEAVGQPPLTIRYDIDIFQQMLDDGRGGQIPGLRRFEGRVLPENEWTLMAYVGEVVLVLDDGRRWNCGLTDNHGRLVNGHGDPPF